MKVYILRGLIGSGKSTWAKKECLAQETYVVSPDKIRAMLNAEYVYNEEEDELVTTICKEAIEIILEAGFDVIVDGCNLTYEGRIEEWLIAAAGFDTKIIGVIFPEKDKDWHVQRVVKSDKGCCKKYWEEVWDIQHEQYERSQGLWFDEVIRLGEQDVS